MNSILEELEERRQ